ncbi:unnamed protein product [Tenebrio molitor]|nr:unnamed protein product [Tenebrio molitor]
MYGFLTEEIVRGFHLVFLFGTTTSRIVFGRRENLIFAATNEFRQSVEYVSTVSHSEIADAAWRSIVCGPYAINIFTSCRGWRDRVLRLHRCCTQQQ